MARKQYRKWTTKDIRHIKDLRNEGYTWQQIADVYNTSKDNICNIFKYYKDVLNDREQVIEEAVDTAMSEAQTQMISYRRQDVRRMAEILADKLGK